MIKAQTSKDLAILSAYLQKQYSILYLTLIRARKTAKFLLKFMLFSLIFLLEIFLQSSVLFMLLGLAFWVLILIIFTSPLWIPLSLCWAPAALITFLVFRYT